jgi:hypothetical protein
MEQAPQAGQARWAVTAGMTPGDPVIERAAARRRLMPAAGLTGGGALDEILKGTQHIVRVDVCEAEAAYPGGVHDPTVGVHLQSYCGG